MRYRPEKLVDRRIFFYSSIAADVRSSVRSTVRLLQAAEPIDKAVLVVVCPAFTVTTDGSGRGYGMFVVSKRLEVTESVIAIGGRYRRSLRGSLSRNEWLSKFLPYTVSHEWCHAIQQRDGRRLTERGIERDTILLMKKARLSCCYT